MTDKKNLENLNLEELFKEADKYFTVDELKARDSKLKEILKEDEDQPKSNT